MFSISNDELKEKEDLGDFILCKKCGKRHIVEYGDKILPDGNKVKSKAVAFVRCQGKVYLVGVGGKRVG